MTEKSNQKKDITKKLLELKNAPTKLLLCANDNTRKKALLNELTAKFYPDVNTITKLNAASWTTSSTQEIINHLQSPGLFTPACLVILENLDLLNAKDLEDLSKALEYTSESASLWLLTRSLNKTSKFRKIFEKEELCLIEYEDLNSVQIKSWIKKEAKKFGINEIADPVSSAIAQITNSSLDQITRLLEHCSLYCNDGLLTINELNTLYPETPEENEFELLDTIHKGEMPHVSYKITKSLMEGKNAFMLLGLINRSYSKYLAIRSMLDQGLSLLQARETLKMKEWPFKKHLEVVQKKSFYRLHSDLEALLLADSKLKNRSLGDIEIFCELAQSLRY
jgi:DNA polymerase III delta subunit